MEMGKNEVGGQQRGGTSFPCLQHINCLINIPQVPHIILCYMLSAQTFTNPSGEKKGKK